MPEETAETIQNLRTRQSDYWPNNDVIQELGTRSLVMLVSPTGVGKSTIIQELAHRDERFARVSVVTTRAPRPDDEPGMFRYAPEGSPAFDRLLHNITERNLVQYQVHPSTGKIYGTETMDYPGEHNCLAILGGAVAKIRSLPFLRSYTFSLACEPTQWHARFQKRYPNSDDPDLAKRLEEAKLNLEWSLNDSETIWIHNGDGELSSTCDAIIDYVTGKRRADAAEQQNLRTVAEAMLASI